MIRYSIYTYTSISKTFWNQMRWYSRKSLARVLHSLEADAHGIRWSPLPIDDLHGVRLPDLSFAPHLEDSLGSPPIPHLRGAFFPSLPLFLYQLYSLPSVSPQGALTLNATKNHPRTKPTRRWYFLCTLNAL